MEDKFSNEVEDLKRRVAIFQESIEHFEPIYREWMKIREWAASLPEFQHLKAKQ